MAHMSRQHFNALAETLRFTLQDVENPAMLGQWRRDVEAICQLCHDSSNFTPNGNRAFDRDRFLNACGYNSLAGIGG